MMSNGIVFATAAWIVGFLYENPFICSCIISILIIINIHLARLIANSGCACGSYEADCACVTEELLESLDEDSFEETQSPINIVIAQAEALRLQEKLKWNHYDDLPASVTIENDGRTVILKAKFNNNIPALCGSDLVANYSFVKTCFRWSHLDFEGSEHTINCTKYPLEMQVMHRQRFGSKSACSLEHNLLMIAYFFEISSYNPYLDPLILNLHRIQKAGTKVNIPPFPLSWLCHPFRTNFYSYGGSSTEPPCNESAEWYILAEPLAINDSQLKEFQLLEASDGKSRILRNARPLQILPESRIVRFNQYNPLDDCILETESCDSTATYDLYE